jgi:predicted PurR-regulated permease PerM
MTTEKDKIPAAASLQSLSIDTAIRIGLIALLGYWCLKVIGPFATIGLWSAILTVALYPLFDALTRLLGSRRLAATLISLLCLMTIVGPLAWLGLGLIHGAEFAAASIDSQAFSIPTPPETIRQWPLIGEELYQLWAQAATDLKSTLRDLTPSLRPLAEKLVDVAGSVVLGLLELIAAIVIAGFLYAPGPRLIDTVRAFLRRILGQRSDEMLQLAGSTIRNVSRGVVGIAFVQACLAGLGFLAAGIPAAGFLTFLAMVLAIIQIGPAIVIIPIVIWSWFGMEPVGAFIFTVYMIPVGLIDNIFRPILMARGLATPMPVVIVGVLGGTLAYGISGLFLGPILLSVAWALITAWVQDG